MTEPGTCRLCQEAVPSGADRCPGCFLPLATFPDLVRRVSLLEVPDPDAVEGPTLEVETDAGRRAQVAGPRAVEAAPTSPLHGIHQTTRDHKPVFVTLGVLGVLGLAAFLALGGDDTGSRAAPQNSASPVPGPEVATFEPTPPLEVPPLPERPASTGVEAFVDAFLGLGLKRDAGAFGPFYANEVDYYAEGTVPRSQVIRDKENYFRVWHTAWSDRTSPVAFTRLEQSTDRYRATFDLRFMANSGTRRQLSAGLATTTLDLIRTPTGFRIVRERQSVRSREVLDPPTAYSDLGRLLVALALPLNASYSAPDPLGLEEALGGLREPGGPCAFRAVPDAEIQLSGPFEWSAKCELLDIDNEPLVYRALDADQRADLRISGARSLLHSLSVSAPTPNRIALPSELVPYARVVQCETDPGAANYFRISRLEIPGRRSLFIIESMTSGSGGEWGYLQAVIGDESSVMADEPWMTRDCHG